MSASRRSASDASSTSPAADPASADTALTPMMLLDTSLVPPAACWMLRAISRVAAPCCSTAAAMAVVTSLISPMVWPMFLIAPTAEVATCCMLTICWRISSVAFAVWLARLFTSEATTAKPRPASPARAASMVALSASRLVCDAIVWIRSTTTLMRLGLAGRRCTLAAGAVGQVLHRGVGGAGLIDRLSGDCGGGNDLLADLLDRGRELFGA